MKHLVLFVIAAASWLRPAAQSSWFATGQNADLMLSGAGFDQTGGALQFNHPNGLASDGSRLLVCDRFNNRILVWRQPPTAADTPPDLVLGQPDFEKNAPGTVKNQLNWPGNASLAANGVLAVADTENDRVLVWKTFPNENAAPADLEICLPALTPPGATMRYEWPWGVWTDGSRLAAVATFGAAILFWNTLPTADNQPPDYTIALPQFGTPRNISTDGATYFFVGDHNAKVNGKPGTFFWNSYPSAANQPFDFYRDEWVKGTRLASGKLAAGGLSSVYFWDAPPTAAGQNPSLALAPSIYKNGDGPDVAECGGRIFINNYNGNNVLIYNDLPTSSNQISDWALGSPSPSANTLDSIGYVQNPVPATDGQRLIVSSDFDRAIYLWDALPEASGQRPDHKISLIPFDGFCWDNALWQNGFAVAGQQKVAIWDELSKLHLAPSRKFNGHIGSATFSDLRGVAMDGQFFYLADRTGKIWLWKNVPSAADEEPFLTLNLAPGDLNHLHSDGTYLTAVRETPPAQVWIFRVSELAAGNATAWKTITSAPQSQLLNLPSSAIAFDGALAVANKGFNQVLLWRDIADAGNPAKMVVLGQPAAAAHDAAIGQNRLFMPGSLLAQGDKLWVGEFKFSSRLLRFSSGTTAAPEVSETARMSIFPNPSAGDFTASFPSSLGGQIRLELLDLQGKTLAQLYEGAPPSDGRVAVSTQHLGLPQGLYFLKMQASTGATSAGKIMLE